jgi:hypothetical protein
LAQFTDECFSDCSVKSLSGPDHIHRRIKARRYR